MNKKCGNGVCVILNATNTGICNCNEGYYGETCELGKYMSLDIFLTFKYLGE
jgi:hypothetical protein